MIQLYYTAHTYRHKINIINITRQNKLSPMSLFYIVIMLNSQSLVVYFKNIDGS